MPPIYCEQTTLPILLREKALMERAKRAADQAREAMKRIFPGQIETKPPADGSPQGRR